ncbi:MAG: hypothetical protein LBD30_08470 [Verrucomicrobiales bacterium]|jgi:hypothetical protein|nr:hypothetical protein [Verrucomicrobiales bacterium]
MKVSKSGGETVTFFITVPKNLAQRIEKKLKKMPLTIIHVISPNLP